MVLSCVRRNSSVPLLHASQSQRFWCDVIQSFLFCARLGLYSVCSCSRSCHSSSFCFVVWQVAMVSNVWNALGLKRRPAKDYRVTLSQVIDSESATLPPYTEADNTTEGVPCFLCSSYSGNTWFGNCRSLEEFRTISSERDIPWSTSESRYEPNSEDLVPKQKKCCAHAVVNTESATTEQQSSANAGAIKTNSDGTPWRLCWVQVDEHVMPIALYQGRVLSDITSAAASRSTSDSFCIPNR